MKKLTVIMPFLNEWQEPADTIASIYETTDPSRVDIIAIDDASDVCKTDLSMFPEVRYIRNEYREGVARSRQIGVQLSQTPYLLIIDGHMRFQKDDWLDKLIDALDREPRTLFCTTCVQLGYGNMDMAKATGKYYGATLVMVNGQEASQAIAAQIIEPKWIGPKDELEYEIPCVLGANYAVRKDWFNHIRGLDGLERWGGDEAFLSLKTWRAGGKCKITRDVEIGHKFRDQAPYTTLSHNMYYNKILMCKTLFPQYLEEKLLSYFPRTPIVRSAFSLIQNQEKKLVEMKSYFNDIFEYSMEEICETHNITLPA